MTRIREFGTWAVMALALLNTAPEAHASTPAQAPQLGASYAVWVRALGPRMANTSADVAGWRPCPNRMTAQILVGFAHNHAIAVTGQPCTSQAMPLSSRRVWAARYAPRDASAHGSVKNQDGWPAALYKSRGLARLLPADAFMDCDGNRVPAGTFTLDLHYAQNSAWALAAGSCA